MHIRQHPSPGSIRSSRTLGNRVWSGAAGDDAALNLTLATIGSNCIMYLPLWHKDANDHSTGANNGTVVETDNLYFGNNGLVGLTAGEAGNCITLTPDADFNMGTNDFTMAGWIKVGAALASQIDLFFLHGDGGIVCNFYIGTDYLLHVQLEDGSPSPINLTGSTTLVSDTWYFLAFRFDRSAYTDGNPFPYGLSINMVSEELSYGPADYTGSSLNFNGSCLAVNSHVGRVAELYWWNDLLTTSALASIYNTNAVAFSKSLADI